MAARQRPANASARCPAQAKIRGPGSSDPVLRRRWIVGKALGPGDNHDLHLDHAGGPRDVHRQDVKGGGVGGVEMDLLTAHTG